jgi:hypothetical protein
MNMFDFYQDDNDPKCQLYLPEGAAVPAEAAAGRKWSFKFQVRDPGGPQRKRIGERGYFMCKVHPDNAGWDELNP